MDKNKDLKETEYLLATIVASSEDAIITIDLARNIKSWNKAAEKLYGHSAREVIGQPISKIKLPDEINELIHQDDRIYNDEPIVPHNTVRIKKGNIEINLEIMLSPVKNSRGQTTGVAAIAREVTRKREVEAMLRQSNELLSFTVEYATDYAIITFDTDASIISWSKGAEQIFGYTQAEAIGQHTSLIFTPEDVAKGADILELSIAREKGRAEDERWHIGKNGKRFFMSGVMTSIMNEEGILIGYAKVARDVTGKKLQEESKDEFIKIAGHELKTPATVLKAYSEILLERVEGNEDVETTTILHAMNNQVNRLIQLINTLLDTTRLTSGEMPIHAENVDFNNLIADQISHLQSICRQHRLIFNPGIIKPVSADKRLMEQILVNLISNAIKYSPDGGDINISTSDNSEYLTVAVQDFGIGIPESAIHHIFERYFRVPHRYANSTPGIGLGLYITESIVRRHGGIISVSSVEGAGSTFSFTIPYRSMDI